MRLNEINARLAEISERRAAISAELSAETADLDALGAEVRSLNEEEAALNAEKRSLLIADVNGGAGTVVRSFPQTQQRPAYNAASPEYRTAWLKTIAKTPDGNPLFGDLSNEERAAYVMTTENTGAVVPSDIQNRIVELVRSESPILTDATVTSFTRGFGVPRHKSIVAGDAAVTGEGEANPDDEEDAFDLLSLDGEEIKKHVVLTRKMEIQSISAFEDWLVTHLAARIRVAKEKLILARLDNADVGIASSNKISGTLSDAEVRKIFGLLKGSGSKVVYASQSMIWNNLAALEKENGDKLFMESAMEDPVVAGRIYGAVVKQNDNIPDNVLYVGYPRSILANEFEDLTIYPSVEPKTMRRIYTAYSLFDAALEKPESFVKYTAS